MKGKSDLSRQHADEPARIPFRFGARRAGVAAPGYGYAVTPLEEVIVPGL